MPSCTALGTVACLQCAVLLEAVCWAHIISAQHSAPRWKPSCLSSHREFTPRAAQVLLERKIVGKVWGSQAEQFHCLRGLDGLRSSVATFGAEHPYTKLVPDLRGVDPDDSFSRVPYEKGFYFLYYLQGVVGGPDAFAPFASAYLSRFGASTATTEQFRAAFEEFFAGCEAVREVDWATWLYAPGADPSGSRIDGEIANIQDWFLDLSSR